MQVPKTLHVINIVFYEHLYNSVFYKAICFKLSETKLIIIALIRIYDQQSKILHSFRTLS